MPSGERQLSDRCGVLCIPFTTSCTGVVDLEDEAAHVEGLDDGDKGTEDLDKDVEGLPRSVDCDLFGSEALGKGDVWPALGDELRLVVAGGVARGVDEILDLYLESISLGRSLRLTGAALFFSEGTNGDLRVSSDWAAFCGATATGGLPLRTSIHNSVQIKPH